MKRSIAIALTLIFSAPSIGQTVYKCPSETPGGTPVLQQTPCPGGAAIPINLTPFADGVDGADGDDELLEKQRRSAEVLESMTRQDALYQEGSLAGAYSGGGGSGGDRIGRRSGGRFGDRPVHVRAYTRSDGTYVHSYDRARPGHGR